MEKKVIKVIARVKSQSGHCEFGFKEGDEIIFTKTSIEGKICIHALCSMIYKVHGLMYNSYYPWLKNPDVATHPCPDVENPVIFELIRVYDQE